MYNSKDSIICSICHETRYDPFDSEVVLGSCSECRKQIYEACDQCHIYAVSIFAADCLYCSNPESGEVHLKFLERKGTSNVVQTINGRAVNNYICPHCKSSECNKNETTCWKCGKLLH